MTVKDLIWVHVCQALKMKRGYDMEKAKLSAQAQNTEQILFLLADLRALARDTNAYCRVAAIKGTRTTRIDPFPTDALPSVAIQKQREEEEKLSKMTPEERDLYLFNKGETIRR